ncbi:hypothetical protein [Robiginitalea aurantiaca]|uniref:DUF3822 family protein n=1 Tax=Robiginitalea aurantiaca TaxID=3056915 RepID=A0ABT7WBD7_9FLAO|nr:hypothetical protein [Robiginitalea aurantiaca]MDM9630225.1 hypothetical protein [Robiginitalea aurantiaca]
MITDKNFSLPYPALGLPEDFTEGLFEVQPKVYISEDELHLVEESVTITNDYIAKLYDNGMVTTVYKIVCPSTLYSHTEYDRKHIILPVSNFANALNIEVFLVALTDINEYTDQSFNPDYFLGENHGIFKVKKGNILGFAGSQRITLKDSYIQGASGLFEFARRNEPDLPMYFDTEDQKITVYYPYSEGNLDIIKTLSVNKKLTFLNLIILPALTQAFQVMKSASEDDRFEELIDSYNWADFLNQEFPDFANRNYSAFECAQLYLKNLIGEKTSDYQLPILKAFFKELS